MSSEVHLPSVDGNTLARILGVSGKVVYDLTKLGVLERGGGKLFDIEINVRKYCDHLRRLVGGTSAAQVVK